VPVLEGIILNPDAYEGPVGPVGPVGPALGHPYIASKFLIAVY
jgi:hypothetical protein